MRRFVATIVMAVLFAVLSAVPAVRGPERLDRAGWQWASQTQNGAQTQTIAGWEWGKRRLPGVELTRPGTVDTATQLTRGWEWS